MAVSTFDFFQLASSGIYPTWSPDRRAEEGKTGQCEMSPPGPPPVGLLTVAALGCPPSSFQEPMAISFLSPSLVLLFTLTSTLFRKSFLNHPNLSMSSLPCHNPEQTQDLFESRGSVPPSLPQREAQSTSEVSSRLVVGGEGLSPGADGPEFLSKCYPLLTAMRWSFMHYFTLPGLAFLIC